LDVPKSLILLYSSHRHKTVESKCISLTTCKVIDLELNVERSARTGLY